MSLGKAFVEIFAKTDKLKAGLKDVKNTTIKVFRDVNGNLKGVQTNTIKTGLSFKKIGLAAQKAGLKIKSTFDQVNLKITRSGLLGLTAALTGIGFAVKNIVGKSVDFETQLAKVGSLLGEDKTALKGFAVELDKMSKEFGQSTETLSDGLFDIISATVPAEKAMKVLKESNKLAVVGFTNTKVATSALLTVLNAYKIDVSEASTVSDKLFNIAKRGRTTFEEVAGSIGRVTATAATAGVSFDELGAFISTLTRNGVSTEESMTAINSAILAFLKPTNDAIAIGKQFGLELNSNTLKSIGLRGALGKLKDANADQLASIFGNVRGLKAMLNALSDVDGITKDYKIISESNNEVQREFAIINETSSQKLKQLSESFNSLKRSAGDLTFVKDFTDSLKGLIDFLNENGFRRVFEEIGIIAGSTFNSIAGELDIFIENVQFVTRQLKNVFFIAFDIVFEYAKNIFSRISNIIVGGVISSIQTMFTSVLVPLIKKLQPLIDKSPQAVRNAFSSIQKTVGSINRSIGTWEPKVVKPFKLANELKKGELKLTEEQTNHEKNILFIKEKQVESAAKAIKAAQELGLLQKDNIAKSISKSERKKPSALSNLKFDESIPDMKKGGIQNLKSESSIKLQTFKESKESQKENKKEQLTFFDSLSIKFSTMKESAELFTNSLKSGFNSAFNDFLDFSKSFGDNLRGLFSNLANAVGNAFKNVIANFLAEKAAAFALSFGKGLLSAIIPGFATGGIATGPQLATIGEAGKERVLNNSQTKAFEKMVDNNFSGGGSGGKISISIKNESGQNLQVSKAEQFETLKGTIISVVLNEANTDPSFRSALA